MEIIRKKICLDGYKSHVNGIFPYIFYDSNNCSIQVDDELDNYGDFVCDIVRKSNDNRLRYLEALRKYYQVTNIIKNALFTPQCHSGCSWTSGITFLNENFCENISGCSISTFDNFEENSDFSLSLGHKVDKEGNFVTKSWAGSGKTTYGYDYIGEPTPIKQYVYYAKDSGIWPQCLYGRYISGTSVNNERSGIFHNNVPSDYTAAISGWFYTDKEETQIFDGNIRIGGPDGEIKTNIYNNKSSYLDGQRLPVNDTFYISLNNQIYTVPSNAFVKWMEASNSAPNGLTNGGNVVLLEPPLYYVTQNPNLTYYYYNLDGTLEMVNGFSATEYEKNRWETYYDTLTSGTTEVCGGSMSVIDFILKYGCLNQQMFVSEDEKNILNSIGKWWKTFWGRHLLKFDITDDAIRFWLEFRHFFIGPKRDTLLTVLNLNPGESFDSNDNYWNNGEVVNTFDIVSPYIEVPICLEQTKTDEGLYTTYEYDLSGDSIVESENTSDLIVNTSFSGLNMPVNSQLYNLVSPDAVIYKDINGNDVIGIPNALGIIEPSGNVDLNKLKAKNGNGQLYLCHYKSGTTIENGAFNIKQSGETLYYYWVAIESNDNITTRLTEPEINTPGYVEVQYVTSIPSIITIDNLEPGDDIYVKAKFDKTLLIPYSATDLTQLESGKYYNVIKKITNSGNTYFKIDYALNVNGSNSGNTGFHYRDIVKYKLEKKTVLVNDIYETEISAYTLDIESSTLLSGETTNVEYQDGKLPLMFFNPAMDGLVDPPEVSVDFSLDRGSAAAWERHFKLMECNTMEDLENYGNNYFNARQ